MRARSASAVPRLILWKSMVNKRHVFFALRLLSRLFTMVLLWYPIELAICCYYCCICSWFHMYARYLFREIKHLTTLYFLRTMPSHISNRTGNTWPQTKHQAPNLAISHQHPKPSPRTAHWSHGSVSKSATPDREHYNWCRSQPRSTTISSNAAAQPTTIAIEYWKKLDLS